MNFGEQLAKWCVEQVLPGCRMVFQASQHVRTCDFDLFLPDGSVAALEVGSATDPQVLMTEAAILDEKRGGPFLPRSLAKHDWYVHPQNEARIDRIRECVDSYLAAIEAEGLTQFFAERDAARSTAVRRIWQELGIEAGSIVTWKHPGIGLALLGGGGWLGPGPVWDAVREVASRADNCEKLAASGRDARHLFVFIDGSRALAWLCLREMETGAMPSVPAEVTYLWVGAAYGGQAIGLHGATSTGTWQRFGPIRLAIVGSDAA